MNLHLSAGCGYTREGRGCSIHKALIAETTGTARYGTCRARQTVPPRDVRQTLRTRDYVRARSALVQDLAATAASILGGLGVVKTFDYLASAGLLDKAGTMQSDLERSLCPSY